MHSNKEGKSVSTYPCRPKAEAFDNVVDVVELLLFPTDQAPIVQHLRVLHVQLDDVLRTLDPAKCRGRVSSARRRGDSDGEVIRAALRLSTT